MKPGNVLHDLLRDRFGIDPDEKCRCEVKRMLMNVQGPAWCRENIAWIVSGMLSEAKKRGWKIDGKPLLSFAAKVGTLTPWGIAYARSWARALVTEAITLCEKEQCTMAKVSENEPTYPSTWLTVDFEGPSGDKTQALSANGIPQLGDPWDPSRSKCVKRTVEEIKPGERYVVACFYGKDQEAEES